VSLEPVKLELILPKGLAAQFDKMFVVREQQYLGSPSQVGEERKDRLCSLIIESDQQVIENEWHRFVVLEIAVERRKPKR
jgi:hypothetical protein